ncbi:MAG TPA: ABC transporter permease [Pyrinomonadaceae bacterium]|nr:ABC transporter permease [Pyrinomonadaceae bacterium]
MKFEVNLAIRYFRSQRKSLARFTALVAIVGIAVGVASLIVAQSLARGFQAEMQDKILANTAHITIFRKDGAEIQHYQQLRTDLAKLENIKKIDATTFESALVIGEKSTNYCVLRVVENAENNLAIGKELAEKTGLEVGKKAEILISNNDSAKSSRVGVNATFQTGLYDYDSTWIYLSPNAYTYIFGKQTFYPTVLSIAVTDIYKAKETANLVRQNLSDEYKIIDWQEANQPLFAALSLEKKVSLAIISLIIFIAVLNITTTLALLVNERRLDIAILRTCGATTKNLLSIFLLEGLFLALIGIIAGVILGVTGCFLANYFHLISLEKEVYSLNQITLQPNLTDVVLIVLIAFVLSLIATLYPAWKASQVKPLENLRIV